MCTYRLKVLVQCSLSEICLPIGTVFFVANTPLSDELGVRSTKRLGEDIVFDGLLNTLRFDAINDAICHHILTSGGIMRTTVTIDEELYQQALDMADPGMDKAELFREAIKTFVRVRAAKRLIALGGSAPDMETIPRRLEDVPAS